MSEPRDSAPRWLRGVLRRLFPGTTGEEVLEDLDREYTARRDRHSHMVARAWYIAQLLRPDTWRLALALRRIKRAEAGERAETTGHPIGDNRSSHSGRPGAGFSFAARRRRHVAYPDLTWLSGLSLDLKLAGRMLLKSPGLTVVGVLGLALGIAVGVGFFIVLSGVFYPTLPLAEGERIVALENRDVAADEADRRSLHDFVTWRDEMRLVDQIAAASIGYRSLTSGGAPARPVRVAEMTAAGFQVARVPPLLGRALVPDDEQEGAALVAVMGYELWQARFEGDPSIIGHSVFVGDEAHVIAGVMPPGFAFPKNQELWTPLRSSPTRHERGEGPELYVFGRLAPGATRGQAQAELTALGGRAAAAFPETNAGLRPQIRPYTYPLDDVEGLRLWEAAQIQFMVNLLLVAIAVNMAVLVYARTAMRQGEIAVRTALGASRRRIVTQLFVEALVLSAIAAALGLATAHVVIGEAATLLDVPGEVGFWVDFGLQPRSAAFAVALAVLAAAIVGVVPGLKSTGRRLDTDLRRLGGGASVRLGWVWTALIVAQVAVAVAVLPTALTIGFREARWLAVRSTFPAHEFLTARMALAMPLRPGMDAATYRRESAARFGDRLQTLERRLEADPAVAGVTIEGSLPGRSHVVKVDGVPGRLRSGGHGVRSVGIGTDYLELLGSRILAGRGLRDADVAEASGGLMVSEAFVRGVLDGDPALGRRLRFLPQAELGWPPEDDSPGPWMEIVGVVQDLQASAFDRQWAPPAVYYAVAPGGLQSADVLVRVRGGDANSFAPRLRQITAALDPDLRIGWVNNLGALRSPRYLALAFTAIVVVLGTVILLSAAGIHALMSLTVTRRRKEIGIRTALGAHPRRVLASIFSRAAWQLGLGGLAGVILGAWLLGWTDLTGTGAVPLLVVVAVMLMAGLMAAVGPARRGLGIHPMEALREE